jgi:hypothetical protein
VDIGHSTVVPDRIRTMSRTYKDAPRRVQAMRDPHPQIWHSYQCRESSFPSRHDMPCDVELSRYHDSSRPRKSERRTVTNTVKTLNPAWPAEGEPMFFTHTRTRTYRVSTALTPGCDYAPSDSSRYHYCKAPGRDNRRELWYGPSRTEERSRFREAIKSYRATGDIDHVELDHQQHRHTTAWYCC